MDEIGFMAATGVDRNDSKRVKCKQMISLTKGNCRTRKRSSINDEIGLRGNAVNIS